MTETTKTQYIALDRQTVARRQTEDVSSLTIKPERVYKTIYKEKGTKKLNASDVYHKNFEPNEFLLAVAGSTRIDLQQVEETSHRNYNVTEPKTYSKFKNYARCVSVRNDGKLIGGEKTGDTCILFKPKIGLSYVELNATKGNNIVNYLSIRPVSSCAFSSSHVNYIATGGEDKSLKIWDISDGQMVFEVPEAHQDKISCIKSEPSKNVNKLVFVTGSYDCFVKIWEFDLVQSNNKSAYTCTQTFDHGDPVSCIDFFPSCMLLVSAGSVNVKIWDVKTSLCVANNSEYIVTSGYDRMVKIHDSSKFDVIHSFRCDEVANYVHYWVDNKGKETILIGLGNGEWFLREFVPSDVENALNAKDAISRKLKAQELHSSFFKRAGVVKPEEADIFVHEFEVKPLNLLDQYIHGFKYKLALERAVKMKDATALALIDYLIDSGVIISAVENRNEETVLLFLNFVHRELGKTTTSTSLLLEFLYVVLEENEWLYSTENVKIAQALQRVSAKIEEDVRSHQLLQELEGMLVRF